jgi:hypothetical protein
MNYKIKRTMLRNKVNYYDLTKWFCSNRILMVVFFSVHYRRKGGAFSTPFSLIMTYYFRWITIYISTVFFFHSSY